jgi:hypothetical protein
LVDVLVELTVAVFVEVRVTVGVAVFVAVLVDVGLLQNLWVKIRVKSPKYQLG